MKYDLTIICAGLVGLATAYQSLLKYPDKKNLVLEIEKDIATNQFGHNSSLIHSGIYYKPGSQNALNCLQGCKLIINFAKRHSIRCDLYGKIIVSTYENELPFLDSIYKRNIENGIQNRKLFKVI